MKDADPHYDLWLYFAEQHDLLLLDTDLHDIKALVAKCVEEEKQGVGNTHRLIKPTDK
jgi:hypothetical protein